MVDLMPEVIVSKHKDTIALIKALSGQPNVLTIPRIFIDLCDGDIEAALFLSQCIYWCDRYKNPHGFFKSEKAWKEELGLSRRGVEKCIVKTEKWVSYSNHRADGKHTRHFKVDYLKVWESIREILSKESPETTEPDASENPETYKTSVSETYKTDVCLTETTQETTTPLAQGAKQTKLPLPPSAVEKLQLTFCAETGLPAPSFANKGDAAAAQKRWLTPLRNILKLFDGNEEQAARLVKDAVAKMRADKLTMSAPQSIEQVAISIYGEKYGKGKRTVTSW